MSEARDVFFARIDQLENGERVALRRAAGKPLEQANGKALTVFYRCLPGGIPTHHEDKWFAVACLRCLWDAQTESAGELPLIFRKMMNRADASGSITHRIETLLDTKWDADGYMLGKLHRLIVMSKQRSTEMPDFTMLLSDLIRWNRDDQIVQKSWARQLFSQE